MIDPREVLHKILSQPSEPDEHIRAQVMIRGKDAKGRYPNNKNIILKRYTFTNFNDYLRYEQEIIDLVTRNNARFYVNPTVKSFESIAFDTINLVVERIRTQAAASVKTAYDSAGDKNKGIKGKHIWIIDIDYKEGSNEFDLSHRLTYDQLKIIEDKLGDRLFSIHETNHGVHVLVKPCETSIIDGVINYIKSLDKTDEVKLIKNSVTQIKVDRIN